MARRKAKPPKKPRTTEKQGDEGRRAPSGLTLRDDARLDRLAIARGWLKDKRGNGLDGEKMSDLIERNYDRAMTTDDDRALASLTRNIITAVGQVMQQEQFERGTPPSAGQPSITIVEVVMGQQPRTVPAPATIEVVSNGRHGGS